MSVCPYIRRRLSMAYPNQLERSPRPHECHDGPRAAWDPCRPWSAVAPGSPLPSGPAIPFGTPSVISDQRLPPHKRGLPQWEGEAGSRKHSKLAVTNASV